MNTIMSQLTKCSRACNYRMCILATYLQDNINSWVTGYVYSVIAFILISTEYFTSFTFSMDVTIFLSASLHIVFTIFDG